MVVEVGQEEFESYKIMKTVPIPSREQVTQLQLGSILSSIATLLPYFHLSDEWDDEKSGGALDGGTKAAVSATLIGLCGRLDSIVADTQRWTLDTTRDLEKQLGDLYKEHANVLRAQQQQLEILSKPHVRHGPVLTRLLDGSWAAVLGSLNDLDNSVVGVGGSPAQALEAFDEMFNGRIPSHLQAWIAVREEALKNNTPPPKYEKSEMDPNASGNPKAPKSTRTQPRRNSKNPRKDEDGSGPQGGSSAEI